MINFLPLIAPLLAHYMPEQKKEGIGCRIVIHALSFIFLITSATLGSIVLYQYLELEYGDMCALSFMSIGFLTASLVTYLIARYLSRPKKPAAQPIANLVKTLGSPISSDVTKKLFSFVSPKMLIGIVGATAILSHFIHDDKNEA